MAEDEDFFDQVFKDAPATSVAATAAPATSDAATGKENTEKKDKKDKKDKKEKKEKKQSHEMEGSFEELGGVAAKDEACTTAEKDSEEPRAARKQRLSGGSPAAGAIAGGLYETLPGDCKDVMKLKKKLREIQKIEAAMESGELVEPNQREKVTKKASYIEELHLFESIIKAPMGDTEAASA
mmetsp:Transcript_92385/g.206502  ORF Transcript_92385/g.206502 Transcript_92385/m.206502 type:complete len:182 (+) Transcript_92385:85-630(+)